MAGQKELWTTSDELWLQGVIGEAGIEMWVGSCTFIPIDPRSREDNQLIGEMKLAQVDPREAVRILRAYLN